MLPCPEISGNWPSSSWLCPRFYHTPHRPATAMLYSIGPLPGPCAWNPCWMLMVFMKESPGASVSGPSSLSTSTSHTLNPSGAALQDSLFLQTFLSVQLRFLLPRLLFPNLLTEFPFPNLSSHHHLFLKPSLCLNGFQASLCWNKVLNVSNPVSHYAEGKPVVWGGSGMPTTREYIRSTTGTQRTLS